MEIEYDPDKTAKLLIFGALLAMLLRLGEFAWLLIAGGLFDPAFGIDPFELRSDTHAGQAFVFVDLVAAVVLFVNAIAAGLAVHGRPGKPTATWARWSANIYITDNIIYIASYLIAGLAIPCNLLAMIFLGAIQALLQSPLVLIARAIKRQTAWSAERVVELRFQRGMATK
jgi:hypothetical protein